METCWNILFSLLCFWYRNVSVEAKCPSLKMFVHPREMFNNQALKNPTQSQQVTSSLKNETKAVFASFNKKIIFFKYKKTEACHLYDILYINLCSRIKKKLRKRGKSVTLKKILISAYCISCDMKVIVKKAKNGSLWNNWKNSITCT